jgi:hypothetical protein
MPPERDRLLIGVRDRQTSYLRTHRYAAASGLALIGVVKLAAISDARRGARSVIVAALLALGG